MCIRDSIRGEYKLPDDVFQTAKICKLLLMMEDGSAGAYKGKCLDEIDLDLEEDLLNNDETTENDDDDYLNNQEEDLLPTASHTGTNDQIGEQNAVNKISLNKTKSTAKKVRVLTPWTQNQRDTAIKFF